MASARPPAAAFIATALVLSFAAPAPAQKVLHYSFKEGEVVQYVVTNRRKERRTVADNKKAIDDVTKTFYVTLSPAKAADAKAPPEIRVHITRVTYRRLGHFGFEKWDSADSDQQPKGRMELFADAKIRVVLDDTGAIKEFKPSKSTAERWQELRRSEKSLVADEVLRTIVPILPLTKESVLRGVRWEQTGVRDEGSLGAFTYTTTHDYAGIEMKRGLTYQTAKLSTTLKPKEAKPKYEVADSITGGDWWFDDRGGHVGGMSYRELMLLLPPKAHKPEREPNEELERYLLRMINESAKDQPGDEDPDNPPKEKKKKEKRGKKTKEEREKEKEKEKEEAEKKTDKSVGLLYERKIEFVYAGKPLEEKQ